MTRTEFAAQYWPEVVSATKGTGILPETALAQMILESNTGDSALARTANNFFGIKAGGNWYGQVVYMPTKEQDKAGKVYTVNAPFRKYNSAHDSVADYVAFLKGNPRYAKAGVFTAKTVEQQAAALKAAGYATDVNYPGLVTSVFNSVKDGLSSVSETVAKTADATLEVAKRNTKALVFGIGLVSFSLVFILAIVSMKNDEPATI